MVVQTGYNPTLVVLSVVLAVFASYTALDLGGHVVGKPGRARWLWLSGAGLAMGGGIWSMHFVGMLAFEMGMPVAYAPGLTLLSFLIAVGATGLGFAWVGRTGARPGDVFLSGPVMGVGVAAMHYTGMAAMRIGGTLAYSLPVVVFSVLIAMTAATAALFLTFRRNTIAQKLLGACVMGVAVAGMHYTGMAAATFTGAGHGPEAVSGAELGLGQQNLALYVTGATFLILFLGMLASSTDTQRVQTSLLASEERFRAAAEAVGDIIWTTDRAGEMRGAQPDWARFTGQGEGDYDGDGWTAAIHPDDVAPTLEAWRLAVAERRDFLFEHRVLRHDGAYRVCAVHAVPVSARDGAIREWVGVHEDITDRRNVETALRAARDAAEAANVAKSTFLANMSHELRTPLSAIIGYSEMLLEEVEETGDEAGVGPDIRKIEGNARHLLGLINDVLDLSKIEAGKMEVVPDAFTVEPMLRELAATVGSLIDQKANRLVVEVAPDLGTARSDEVKIRQILLNFLSNAAKFTQAGTVRLVAARQAGSGGDDHLVFSVVDSGIGMTDEQMEKLFARFQQADSSTTRRFGGTGLGLSLSKAFAEMLGGSVSLASAPGQGSTFTLRVPAVYVPPAAAEPVEAEAVLEEAGPGSLVLVIDDDPDQRILMTRFLRREGFRVQVAANGEAGLDLARRLRPRAILLDVMMPGVDGWSVLSAIKADHDLAATPVIMVTAVEQRSLAASLGASDYMKKPVDWARFKAMMARFRPQTGDVRDTILLIEDDAFVRTAMRSTLEEDGWSVEEAGNGQEGLDRATANPPHAVVVDLNMPVMDGFTFLARFRGVPGCADTPVMVLTGRNLSAEDRRKLRGPSQILNRGEVGVAGLLERLRGLADQPAPEP